MHIWRLTLVVLAISITLCAQDALTVSGSSVQTTEPVGTTAPEAATQADQQTQAASQASPTGTTAIVPPATTPRDLAEAKRDFSAGMKLKSAGKTQEALDKFESAARLDPSNVQYITAREVTRQQLVMQLIEQGNKEMLANNEVAAAGYFRHALEIDPTNEFARQRLKDSVWTTDKVPSRTLEITQKSIDVRVSPKTEVKDFHYKGDSRNLLVQVARAYGITATIDDSVTTRQVRFDIDNVNFEQAMEAATRVTKTFWIPLSGSQMYIVSDTAENRRNFERMAIRTFYLNDILTPQELTDTTNALRVLLDIRFVQQNVAEQTITIRAPLSVIEAATQLIESLAGGRPQLMLDMQVFQVSSSLMRQLGTQLYTNFTLINISPSLLASLLGTTSTDLINQLIASGGINQANSQAIQALLAQVQQASKNPLLSSAFATFGGGLTLMGLSGSPPIAVNLHVNESDVRNLEHVTLRASQNSPAVLKLGQRYPFVNATFAPIYNNASIAQVIGNQSYVAPFPSFNYEDLGLNLKATPIIHANSDVSLKIEINIRTLAGQAVNGIPIINNRQYTGTITIKNGETGVVAGLMSKADSMSINGYPFLSRVPAVNYATAVHDKNVNEDELLIVMTPHIVRTAPSQGFAVQLPAGH